MSDLPTPETDAAPKLLGTTMGQCNMVNTDFARSLERRLILAERRLEWCLKYGQAKSLAGALSGEDWRYERLTIQLIDAALDQIGKEAHE